jgi:hypothetical protein
MDYQAVIELEKCLLDPKHRKNLAFINATLDEQFLEYGSSGRIYNKKIIIDFLMQEDAQSVDAFDFESVQLAPDVIQLRFKTRRKAEDGLWSSSLRSSIWKKSDGGWRLIFHQGTFTNP